ncbi:hypothetical protein H696_00158 [Fonticula alba]|uniref:Methyltransferase domain-containing protein n=1 Tax=Fonticula alba TaxID=691883 RepID=A0A058ZGF3_FONAL|nr:hypothetical protein H696_00158 [Fonticula alba]KCV72567.1 hypothetical protein H696_00158 [Fonticula alba]|eukprot:XP_009492268.1 hypothetical protein H696_00158 [Fonticula alba]
MPPRTRPAADAMPPAKRPAPDIEPVSPLVVEPLMYFLQAALKEVPALMVAGEPATVGGRRPLRLAHLGCGSGRLTQHLARLAIPGARDFGPGLVHVIGVDHDLAKIRHARLVARASASLCSPGALPVVDSEGQMPQGSAGPESYFPMSLPGAGGFLPLPLPVFGENIRPVASSPGGGHLARWLRSSRQHNAPVDVRQGERLEAAALDARRRMLALGDPLPVADAAAALKNAPPADLPLQEEQGPRLDRLRWPFNVALLCADLLASGADDTPLDDVHPSLGEVLHPGTFDVVYCSSLLRAALQNGEHALRAVVDLAVALLDPALGGAIILHVPAARKRRGGVPFDEAGRSRLHALLSDRVAALCQADDRLRSAVIPFNTPKERGIILHRLPAPANTDQGK